MKGSCLCGAIEYEVDQLDMPISHCPLRQNSCRLKFSESTIGSGLGCGWAMRNQDLTPLMMKPGRDGKAGLRLRSTQPTPII